jgi:hypothetical protein
MPKGQQKPLGLWFTAIEIMHLLLHGSCWKVEISGKKRKICLIAISMCLIALLWAARKLGLSSDTIVVGRTSNANIHIFLSPSPERQPNTRTVK